MDVLRIREGLWRWTAPHPAWTPEPGGTGGWPRDVACVCHETPEAIVLIDPLAPPPGTPDAEKFWRALDGDVARRMLPVVVLIGNRYHGRSADAVRERYGAAFGVSVLAHHVAREHVACALTGTFRHGEVLPGGVEAIGLDGYELSETVFRLPAGKSLVVADVLIGAGGGRVRVVPAAWAPQDPESQAAYRDLLRPSLRRLLDRPFEHLLVSHGEAVLARGPRALDEALSSPAWGA